MLRTIRSEELTNDLSPCDFTIDTPSQCPHCGISVEPSFLSSHFIRLGYTDEYFEDNPDDSLKYRIFVAFLCNNCLKAFNAEYGFFDSLYEASARSAEFIAKYPAYHSSPTHNEEIKKLSPKYIEIYNEAHYAEELNLKEICGMGYRKALEFLIKDYAIKLNPADEENIKKCSLANCINEFIDNTRIKTLAKASAWIGNDETHYCRKHSDYDLNSLKAFINATVSYINSEMEAIKAEELLQNPK